jgi:hypothetical protein
MKSISLRSFRRAAALLPAFGLLLAPLAAQAMEREDPSRDRVGESIPEENIGGRAGIIEEFNFGPLGGEALLKRQDTQDEGGTRLLSGRVVELKGRTLYVERNGVVVPLDMSALRIKKQPKPGQQIIAEYQVARTQNIALSLAGEVPPSAVE